MGLSVADKVSHFSRFAGKFIEIVAAGVATAVSGYLVAHLSGFFSAPAPTSAAVAPAPSAAIVLKTPHVPPAPAGSADVNEPRPPVPDVKPPAAAPVTTASVPQATTTRKRSAAARSAEPAESKPRNTDAAEAKARDLESVAAQVRAALANVDATRPASPEPPARPAESAAPGAAALQPNPTAELTPQPVQQTPVQPEALPSVEIKSRPVATVDAVPPQSASAAPDDAQEDKSPFSALKKILLRSAGPEPADQAPRPPQSVGE